MVGIVHLHVIAAACSGILLTDIFQLYGVCCAGFISLEYIPAVPSLANFICRTVLNVTALWNYIARCKLHGYWKQLLRVVGGNGKLKLRLGICICSDVGRSVYLILHLFDAVEMDIDAQSMLFGIVEVDGSFSPVIIYDS